MNRYCNAFIMVCAMVMMATFQSGCSIAGASSNTPAVIVNSQSASFAQTLAAREVRRYVYLRTGELLPIVNQIPNTGDVIIVDVDPALDDQQYRLKTTTGNGRQLLQISGGSDIAALYGVYHFAEKLGIRFELQGDVIPDQRVAFAIPQLDETHKPLFNVRGIQPFHDFTEGPDWWTLDDYKTYMSQLAKLRMNWIGFHCYPEGGVGPEPLIWIGLPEDVNEDGTVKFSYPSRWASTSGGSWGYAPTKTSDFAAGASLLFESDDFGNPVTDGYRPLPKNIEDCNEVFNRAGRFMNAAFMHARSLGIRTVIGTETPLTIPKALQQHLKDKGLDPKDPAVIHQLYQGMFKRIARTHPLDYYWLWTPESWTWGTPKQKQVDVTISDIKLATKALKNTDSPFGFATSGWVLGPPNDRALFDKTFDKDVALSCINRRVGFDWVEQGFSRINGRPQWAIPWMEDDPAMVIPQLWAGRMRRDAADAHAYGCTVLIGIHWRTKVLSPNVTSLAAAAWIQQPWNADFGKKLKLAEPITNDVYIGGRTANYPHKPIAQTDDDPIYQCCRYDLSGYHIRVPNGTYNITLKFCEVAYTQSGKRVFGVKLQGKQVIDRLDIFTKVGSLKPFDQIFNNIKITNEKIEINFVKQVEFPLISAIVIQGQTASSNQLPSKPYTRKINCGGAVVKEYEADLRPMNATPSMPDRPRDLPADDFYRDWCNAQFGMEVNKPMTELFTRLDGGTLAVGRKRQANLPRPSQWIGGPGGIIVNGKPWKDEKLYSSPVNYTVFTQLECGSFQLAMFSIPASIFFVFGKNFCTPA